ncbi:MAG: beta-1,6-N-acetylglucosaminyltransferase [Dysgonamonadaceae bacterium]|jgi:hypothetical protein|nr:beta-1,6-N-acetylglucosaminyltransferase [Dysgonamonadaceae bacterium]
MKHACLILAHNEFEVLERLIRALDDVRNDIYIHFDRKLKEYPAFQTRHAGLYVLTERIDVRWGDVSVVEAEYALFEAAYRQIGYDYYHLLSGVDMPLKSPDYIHDFFDKHKGKEFIGYYQGNIDAQIERKVQRYHLFPKHFRETKGWKALGRKCLRSAFLRLQILLGIKRNRNVLFKKGTQWISITGDFVEYLLARKKQVLDTCRHTFCSDEIFVQTVCWSSPFRDRIYDPHDEGHGCMRMINWKDNRLKEWEEKDYGILMQSDALFARKFSGKHIEVVNRILNQIEC